jgi:hypothetical protein
MLIPCCRASRGFQARAASVNLDFSVVWFMDTGEQLHQRRFSGAILADHGVNFAATNFKTHLVERGHAAKVFRHAIEFDVNRIGSHVFPLIRENAAEDEARPHPGPLPEERENHRPRVADMNALDGRIASEKKAGGADCSGNR